MTMADNPPCARNGCPGRGTNDLPLNAKEFKVCVTCFQRVNNNTTKFLWKHVPGWGLVMRRLPSPENVVTKEVVKREVIVIEEEEEEDIEVPPTPRRSARLRKKEHEEDPPTDTSSDSEAYLQSRFKRLRKKRRRKKKKKKITKTTTTTTTTTTTNALECGICADDVKATDAIVCQVGIHSFCSTCMRRYFETNVAAKGKHDTISCPSMTGCDSFIKEIHVQHASPGSLSLFNTDRAKRALGSYSKTCPACETVGYVSLEDLADPYIECLQCYTQMCTRCDQAYHGDMSCTQAEAAKKNDRKFNEDMKDQGIFPCARCGIPLSKEQPDQDCQKVCCMACHAYTCFCCGGEMPQFRPYSHFCRGSPNDPVCDRDGCKHCYTWPAAVNADRIPAGFRMGHPNLVPEHHR